jgi:dihydroflavonol-4-reductase
MKVIVTGANGFLAGYIIRNLIHRKVEVFGLYRKTANAKNLIDLSLNHIHGDILNTSDLNNAFQGIDVVIHTAALTSPSAKVNDYYRVNVIASRYVLDAAISNNCKRIIYISTANTIGFGDKQIPGKEEFEISPEFKGSDYAMSKWVAENMFTDAASEGKIEVIIVNPSFMIGYDAKLGSTMKIFNLFLKSNPLLVPGGGKNFIYVDDAAKAVCNALSSGTNGSRYLLVNENLSYYEFFKKVESVSKISKQKIKIPNALLRSIGYLVSLMNMFGFNLPLNSSNARILTIKNYYSPNRAIAELHLPQTSIDVAINEALKWYRL